jgi:hypothetical protein
MPASAAAGSRSNAPRMLSAATLALPEGTPSRQDTGTVWPGQGIRDGVARRCPGEARVTSEHL